jgi:galactokinase
MSDPTGQAKVNAVAQAFRARYGAIPQVFSAPGRVNLIGEHTDYNEGWVLPIATKERTRVAAAARSDRVIRAYSQSLKKERSFSLDDAYARRGKWLDYVEGVARALLTRGIPVGGADLMIASDVPPGAGLSSSAALELGVGQALVALSSSTISPRDLALAGQAAEHDYVGVECGIMDQLVSALGRAGHALLIDCRSLDITEVKIPDFPARIVVFDTHVHHAHAQSGYNRRRAECQEALELLQKAGLAKQSLREVTLETLDRALAKLPEPLSRRVRHVVRENGRTSAAVDALRRSHLSGLGRLMNGSHASLRDDYEVSVEELDFTADALQRENGVLGARMTGGGFGGSVVALVKDDKVGDVSTRLGESFRARFKVDLGVTVTQAGDGMRAERFAAA